MRVSDCKSEAGNGGAFLACSCQLMVLIVLFCSTSLGLSVDACVRG